jgi:hypothetical protein
MALICVCAPFVFVEAAGWMRGGRFDLQLKSTTQASVTDAEIRYDVEVRAYNHLREPGENTPRILVVLVMPEHETQWLTQTLEELALRSCAYWICLEGYPATTASNIRARGHPTRKCLFGGGASRVFGTLARKESLMQLRNPWIDPRVLEIKSADARRYLLRRGWKLLSAESEPLLDFEGPPNKGEATVVSLPTKEQARDYPQRIIELLTDVALAEDRYAGDLLNDILQQASAVPVSANGPGMPLPVEPAPK